jgi:transposase/transposase-like protein
MTKQFTSDLKLKSVKYYNKIKNYVKVCNIFECSERSLKRWVEQYKKYKHLDRKSRKTGSYKLKKIHIDFITKSLKKENDIQMNTLHNQIKNKFPELNISRQYLSDIIRDNNITRKRAVFQHFPKTYRGNIRDEKKELKEFFNTVSKFNLDDIISIDETSVSTSLTYNYCRSYIGKRCVKKTDNNEKFKKYSLVVAINNKKCINYELYQKGAVNSDRFNIFLQNICNTVKNKLFILDNGQIHKTDTTKDIIKNSGNFLLYTCPYHPRLNSIEQFFNQMKHYIKLDKPTTYLTLNNSVKTSISKIKPENYKNYFIYAYNKDYYKTYKKSKKYNRRREQKIYKD